MFVVIIWLFLCFVIAAGASSRGRSGVGWFFISALVSPIIGTIILVCLPPIGKEAPQVDDNENARLKEYIKKLEEKAVDKSEEALNGKG